MLLFRFVAHLNNTLAKNERTRSLLKPHMDAAAEIASTAAKIIEVLVQGSHSRIATNEDIIDNSGARLEALEIGMKRLSEEFKVEVAEIIATIEDWADKATVVSDSLSCDESKGGSRDADKLLEEAVDNFSARFYDDPITSKVYVEQLTK